MLVSVAQLPQQRHHLRLPLFLQLQLLLNDFAVGGGQVAFVFVFTGSSYLEGTHLVWCCIRILGSRGLRHTDGTGSAGELLQVGRGNGERLDERVALGCGLLHLRRRLRVLVFLRSGSGDILLLEGRRVLHGSFPRRDHAHVARGSNVLACALTSWRLQFTIVFLFSASLFAKNEAFALAHVLLHFLGRALPHELGALLAEGGSLVKRRVLLNLQPVHVRVALNCLLMVGLSPQVVVHFHEVGVVLVEDLGGVDHRVVLELAESFVGNPEGGVGLESALVVHNRFFLLVLLLADVAQQVDPTRPVRNLLQRCLVVLLLDSFSVEKYSFSFLEFVELQAGESQFVAVSRRLAFL